MPYAGDFTAVTPGEQKSFSIDFSAQLATGETITSVASATLTSSPLGKSDFNASALLLGSPTHTATVASQFVGGAFQPNTIYVLTLSVVTSANQTLVNYGHIPCSPIV